jgi:hypothetical protein
MRSKRGKKMRYLEWIKSIITQLDDYRQGDETDLVLLRNHLNNLVNDIEQSPEFKVQLKKCID